MEKVTKLKRQTGVELDRERLLELCSKMRSWSDLSETISTELPGAIAAAVMSGRPELIYATDFKGMTPEQAAGVCRVAAILLETNRALQVHAEELAQKTHALYDGIKGLRTLADRLDNFANFRTEVQEEEEVA